MLVCSEVVNQIEQLLCLRQSVLAVSRLFVKRPLTIDKKAKTLIKNHVIFRQPFRWTILIG
jgi:hypothetical protein